MTKKDLYNYANQLDTWKKSQTVFLYLLKDVVEKFYADFKEDLETLQKDIRAIEEHHLEFDGDVVRLEMVHVEGKPDEEKLVTKEGKTEYSFGRNLDALMKQLVGEKFTVEDYPLPEVPAPTELPPMAESDLKVVN